MSFWDIFSSKKESTFLNNLHGNLTSKFPELEENQLILMACLSGLLARIAYVDFEIHKAEEELIKHTLSSWHGLGINQANEVAQMAISEMVSFAGLDTRDYCTPLNTILSNDQKFDILKLLFKVAASDENVDNNETEEIRIIATGLLLEHKHFIAAKASVKDSLATLRK